MSDWERRFLEHRESQRHNYADEGAIDSDDDDDDEKGPSAEE